MSCLTSCKIDEACDFICLVLIFINNHLATVILLVIIVINSNATGQSANVERMLVIVSVWAVILKCHSPIVHFATCRCSQMLSLVNSLFYLLALLIWPSTVGRCCTGDQRHDDVRLQDAICSYCWRVDTMWERNNLLAHFRGGCLCLASLPQTGAHYGLCLLVASLHIIKIKTMRLCLINYYLHQTCGRILFL